MSVKTVVSYLNPKKATAVSFVLMVRYHVHRSKRAVVPVDLFKKDSDLEIVFEFGPNRSHIISSTQPKQSRYPQ